MDILDLGEPTLDVGKQTVGEMTDYPKYRFHSIGIIMGLKNALKNAFCPNSAKKNNYSLISELFV